MSRKLSNAVYIYIYYSRQRRLTNWQKTFFFRKCEEITIGTIQLPAVFTFLHLRQVAAFLSPLNPYFSQLLQVLAQQRRFYFCLLVPPWTDTKTVYAVYTTFSKGVYMNQPPFNWEEQIRCNLSSLTIPVIGSLTRDFRLGFFFHESVWAWL